MKKSDRELLIQATLRLDTTKTFLEAVANVLGNRGIASEIVTGIRQHVADHLDTQDNWDYLLER